MDADIDLLVNNFKQLWKSGRSAHLDIDSHAGQAWIGLRVRLGHVHVQHDHQHEVRTRNGPSRQRRRIRRAAARQETAEEAAAGASVAEKATTEACNTEGNYVTAEATDDNSVAEEANVVVAASPRIAEKAFSCAVCGKTFTTVNGLRTHEGKQHKPSLSPIPQIDGSHEMEY